MNYEVNLDYSGGLSEIYQSVNMKFAFCNVDKVSKTKLSIKQLHPWVKCRDFLGDALFATHHKVSYSVFGFKFDGTTKAVPTDLTYLLIQHTSKEQLEKIVPVINYLEKKVRWKQTKLIDLNTNKNNNHVMLAIASKKWVSSTALISLYTMLWRLGGIDIKDDETTDQFLERCATTNDNDGKYLKQIVEAQKILGLKEHLFYTIMRYNGKIFANGYEYNPSGDIPYRVHNCNGILSLSNFAKDHIQKPTTIKSGVFASKPAKVLATIAKREVKKA